MDKTVNSQACGCYLNEIEALPLPRFRMICHCKTCQEFLGADFNDECVYLRKDCPTLDLTGVRFKRYQTGFSPVQRGICERCHKPSFCRIKLAGLPEFLMVPTSAVSPHKRPSPSGHVYYHSRKADTEDACRKVNGHYLSQLYIALTAIKALLK